MIVVVGKTSFLARRFLALRSSRDECCVYGHDEISNFLRDPGATINADVVVNFALDPRMHIEPYDEAFDIDQKIARRVSSMTRYIMISTRKVYSQKTFTSLRVIERTPADPDTIYGTNKLRIENRLRDLLRDRVTILRVPNVIADVVRPDRAPSRPLSFVPRMLSDLRKNLQIRLDVSPFTRRDFITDRYLVDAIERGMRLSETYNLGSGNPIPVGQIALWLMEGYGAGELVCTSPHVLDPFWFSPYTLGRSAFGGLSIDNIRSACFDLGTRARAIREEDIAL